MTQLTQEPKRKTNFFNAETAKQQAVIVISACLLGDNVRYDGKNKKQTIFEQLEKEGAVVKKVCPEVAAGLSVPRPAIQLTLDTGSIHAIGVNDSNIDVTEKLIRSSSNILAENNHATAFILKSRSPSCGVGNTPLFSHSNQKIAATSGLFANEAQKKQAFVLNDEHLQNHHNIASLINFCLLLLDFKNCNDSEMKKFCSHHQINPTSTLPNDIFCQLNRMLISTLR